MSLRIIAVFGVVAVLIIAYVGWTRNMQRPATAAVQTEPPAAGAPEAMPPATEPSKSVAPATGNDAARIPVVESATNPGLEWTVPPTWKNQGPTSMRLATYVVSGPNKTEAQCAVYYFGIGQGGSVDANLQRWQGEFKDAVAAKIDHFEANGVAVSRMRAEGTYLAHVGMMGQGSETEMPNWAMLGAIAEGPRGSVFFKFTGPAVVMNGASADFERMLKSLHAH
jgi:hypothetical protein